MLKINRPVQNRFHVFCVCFCCFVLSCVVLVGSGFSLYLTGYPHDGRKVSGGEAKYIV